MEKGLGVNGAGYHDYEDVNPPATEEEILEDETLEEDFEEADFTGASDEIGYANDR